MTDETLRTAALAEALDYYLEALKKCDANEAAVALYTDLLSEVDPEGLYH